MSAPSTNLAKLQILVYGAHPDHLPGGGDPWPVHRWALRMHGSYAVRGATDSALDGVYRGYMDRCVYSNNWGRTTSPSIVTGEFAITLVRNTYDTALDMTELDHHYNFLIGYEFLIFRIWSGDPLPIESGDDSNLLFGGKVGAGDLEIVRAEEGGNDQIIIRLGDRMKFDDIMATRQKYEFQTEAGRWSDKPKPILLGDWRAASWQIEAPVIVKERCTIYDWDCDPDPLDEFFTADLGAVADDTPDARNASENWANLCALPVGAPAEMQEAENEWRWKESWGEWFKVAGDVRVNPYTGLARDLGYTNNVGVGWDPVIADSVGSAGSEARNRSLAMDSNGALHACSWNRATDKLRYSTNASGEWVAHTPDDTAERGKSCSLALDSNDKVHISYWDESNEHLLYATNVAGGWTVHVVDDGDNGGPVVTTGVHTSIAADGDDKIHISYCQSEAPFTLRYATNETDAWVLSDVDNGVATGYTSLALDAADKAHISYHDSTNSFLKYATNESGGWILATPDPWGGVGGHTSIALDSDEKAHISYYFSLNANLGYATNESGAWNWEILVGADDLGKYTSIAIDTDDKVHISYYNESEKSLNYASNETGGWIFSIADSDTECGRYTSIVLDADDKSHITYYIKASTTYAWRGLHLIDNSADEWGDNDRAMLKYPQGLNIWTGDGPPAGGPDPAVHPVDIILLLLRDTKMGASVDVENIDEDSFVSVKDSLGDDVRARRWVNPTAGENFSVLDLIATICNEFQLKLVVEGGKYKLIYLNWTDDPAPDLEIQGGEIDHWTLKGDKDIETNEALTINYCFDPAIREYTKTFYSMSYFDAGTEPKVFYSNWIYQPADVSSVGSRYAALYAGTIQNLRLWGDFSTLGFELGDRLVVNDPDAPITTSYQVQGYVRDFVAVESRLDLIAIYDLVT